MKNRLRVFPNPFHRLDHQGVPAAAFPFDPSHSPDRRWVGARIDRSEGPDGLPRTRAIETEGDLSAAIPRGRLKGRVVSVDRAPRKRVAFAFDLSAPADLPATGHYLLGLREGSLIAADEETAKAAGKAFAPPKDVLRASASRAIAEWKREHGEEPDFALWPENLLAAAGLAKPASEEPAAPTPKRTGLPVPTTEQTSGGAQ